MWVNRFLQIRIFKSHQYSIGIFNLQIRKYACYFSHFFYETIFPCYMNYKTLP